MLATALSLSASAAEPAPAATSDFVFNDPNSRDTVTFMLDGPLEVINGLSNQVKGRSRCKDSKASGRFRCR